MRKFCDRDSLSVKEAMIVTDFVSGGRPSSQSLLIKRALIVTKFVSEDRTMRVVTEFVNQESSDSYKICK